MTQYDMFTSNGIKGLPVEEVIAVHVLGHFLEGRQQVIWIVVVIVIAVTAACQP